MTFAQLLAACQRARGVLLSLPPSVANTKNLLYDLEMVLANVRGS